MKTFTMDRKYGVAAIAGLVLLAATGPARSDSTPVGQLPAGASSTTTTHPGQLVAVALPQASTSSGLVWRIARKYNAHVVRQVAEADIGTNVVLVFKVVGPVGRRSSSLSRVATPHQLRSRRRPIGFALSDATIDIAMTKIWRVT